jgi:aspartate/tyrosine/aromatic aminotransferase
MFFSHITETPQEGLFETYLRFLKDESPTKVNLSLGMYYNLDGSVVTLDVVKKAECAIAQEGRSRGYLPISGVGSFGDQYTRLLLGEAVYEKHYNNLSIFQTLGATGALSTMASLLKEALVEEIYLSQPTWGNHKHIFSEAGLKLQYYPYLDSETNLLKIDAMLDKLQQIPKGSVVLLQTCCHNPTGVDPTVEEWQQILRVVIEQGHFPLFDFAYQGFAEGVHEDAYPLQFLASHGADFACCASTSKNFGIYAERTGVLVVHSETKKERDRVFDRLKFLIRGNYSNPPAHGAWIVDKILSDQALYDEWIATVDSLKRRLVHNREKLKSVLVEALPDRDYSYITKHRGMFSLLGINPEQVKSLEGMGFYLAPSGRINVAGVSDTNLEHFAGALRKVIYKK